jgi:hypothetical protein
MTAREMIAKCGRKGFQHKLEGLGGSKETHKHISGSAAKHEY